MDRLPTETAEVLGDLIAQSEAHRGEQMDLLHALNGRGESTAEALRVLGQMKTPSPPCGRAGPSSTHWIDAPNDPARSHPMTQQIGLALDFNAFAARTAGLAEFQPHAEDAWP